MCNKGSVAYHQNTQWMVHALSLCLKIQSFILRISLRGIGHQKRPCCNITIFNRMRTEMCNMAYLRSPTSKGSNFFFALRNAVDVGEFKKVDMLY